jgi:hypothetical protein
VQEFKAEQQAVQHSQTHILRNLFREQIVKRVGHEFHDEEHLREFHELLLFFDVGKDAEQFGCEFLTIVNRQFLQYIHLSADSPEMGGAFNREGYLFDGHGLASQNLGCLEYFAIGSIALQG